MSAATILTRPKSLAALVLLACAVLLLVGEVGLGRPYFVSCGDNDPPENARRSSMFFGFLLSLFYRVLAAAAACFIIFLCELRALRVVCSSIYIRSSFNFCAAAAAS